MEDFLDDFGFGVFLAVVFWIVAFVVAAVFKYTESLFAAVLTSWIVFHLIGMWCKKASEDGYGS